MMPIPPTSSEIPAMAPSMMFRYVVIWLKTPRISCWEAMVKSSSSKSTLCRSLRITAISSIAASVLASSMAAAYSVSTRIPAGVT